MVPVVHDLVVWGVHDESVQQENVLFSIHMRAQHLSSPLPGLRVPYREPATHGNYTIQIAEINNGFCDEFPLAEKAQVCPIALNTDWISLAAIRTWCSEFIGFHDTILPNSVVGD
jgi:hypothetical protein